MLEAELLLKWLKIKEFFKIILINKNIYQKKHIILLNNFRHSFAS